MADVQVLKPMSPLRGLATEEQQPPESPTRMRTYCANLATQNGALQRRLQRSDESNAFLKAHAEQLKFEIAQLKSEMSIKARNVMALQFKLLRQDLLNCASQATARKTVQELRVMEERLEQVGREMEGMKREREEMKREREEMGKEVERLGFAVTGVQYVADKLEERNKDLEQRNQELEKEVERLKLAEEAWETEKCIAREAEERYVRELEEKDEEVRRTKEKMEALEEYVAASKAADELVSDTFTNVLATLDAWKRGDEEEEEAYVEVEEQRAGAPTIVVSQAEDDEVVVMERRKEVSWSHEAILDSWTAPPATDANAAACPSSLSCTIPLPSSPTGLGVDDSPITPTGPLANIEEEEEEESAASKPESSSAPRKSPWTFDGDVPGSPTVVGSGSELDTESENESLADDEHEAGPLRINTKVYDSATDSPMLLFRKFAHGIPEEEFAPLIHERFSPVDVRFENSDDEVSNKLAASLMRKRSNSLSSIGTCDGLETFRRDFAQPKIPSPLGNGRRRQDRLPANSRRRAL